jgi:siroheme synthase
VLVAENASLPEFRRIALTLEELPEIARYGVSGPAVIMLGRVFAAALSASERDALHRYAHA